MGKKIVLTGVTLTDIDAPTLQDGINLLLNGSFETSATTGTGPLKGTETRALGATGATDGTSALQVTTTSNGAEGAFTVTDTGLGGSGRTFVAAVDVTGSVAVKGFIRAFYTDATSDIGPFSANLTATGTPQRLTMAAFTTSATKTLDYIRFYVRIADDAGATTTFSLDSAKLEEGTAASPYSAPGTAP